MSDPEKIRLLYLDLLIELVSIVRGDYICISKYHFATSGAYTDNSYLCYRVSRASMLFTLYVDKYGVTFT